MPLFHPNIVLLNHHSMSQTKNTLFFMRLPIAFSLLGHGLVRLPKLSAFSNGMVASMQASVLPSWLIHSFALVLPFIEIAIGIALLIGFRLQYAIYAGLVLMSLLIAGSSSIENWGAIEAQLIHAIYLGLLLIYYERVKHTLR